MSDERTSAKNFQLTLNEAVMDHYEEIKDYLMELGANYFISCIEQHKRGTLHMHIYVQFEKQKKLSTNKTKGAHIEVCRGTPQENKNYVTKIKRQYGLDNTWEEIGNMRLADIKSNMAVSLMELELNQVTKTDFRVWKEVKTIQSFTKNDIYKPNLKVYYIWGESGKGKSKAVFDRLEDNERFDRIKYSNGYWIGVNQLIPCKTCWYDDFRDTQMQAVEFINFIDYYKNQMNLKYCPSWVNQYERIFITSIQSPHKIYKNVPDETREQWLRRLIKIHKNSFAPINWKKATTTRDEEDEEKTIEEY